MPRLSKKGALNVTKDLDRVANVIQTHCDALGLPEKIASDFAYRCDLLSDAIEKSAGLSRQALNEFDPVKEQGFNPEEIGQEVGGPEVHEADEPFMKAEFTQQENRELRERQQAGDLGMKPNHDEQTPTPGKQASSLDSSIARLSKQAQDMQLTNLSDLENQLKVSAAKLDAAGGVGKVAGSVDALATSVGKAKDQLIQAGAFGLESGPLMMEADKLASAVGEVLPYVTKLADGLAASKMSSSPTEQLRSQELVEKSSERLARLLDLATKIADDSGKKIAAAVSAAKPEKKKSEKKEASSF